MSKKPSTGSPKLDLTVDNISRFITDEVSIECGEADLVLFDGITFCHPMQTLVFDLFENLYWAPQKLVLFHRDNFYELKFSSSLEFRKRFGISTTYLDDNPYGKIDPLLELLEKQDVSGVTTLVTSDAVLAGEVNLSFSKVVLFGCPLKTRLPGVRTGYPVEGLEDVSNISVPSRLGKIELLK